MFPRANGFTDDAGNVQNSPGYLPLDEKTFRRVYLRDEVVDERVVQIVEDKTKNH